MSNDAIRVVLAVVVGAHGVGHVLFAPLADSVMKLPASGHSSTSSAFFGLAFDAVVLVALLVLRWPTDAVVRG